MEPNKLEKEFSKKLKQRTIQPSEMAWDRLDAMLSVAEKKKRPGRAWMYIAASFLGFLLVATLFLKHENTGSETVIKNNGAGIVEKEPGTQPEQQTQSGTANGGLPQTKAETAVALAGDAGKGQEAKKETPSVKKEVVSPTLKEEAVIAENNKEVQESGYKYTDASRLLAEVETGKVQETNTDPSKQAVASKKSPVKVDSNSLLSSVEGELNQSFREKALQTVSKNFNAVKSSLANRNYQ